MSRNPWQLLTYDSLVASLPTTPLEPEDQSIWLIRKPAGTCVVGVVKEINSLAFRIENGIICEVITFSNQLLMFQVLPPPSKMAWSKGEKQLGLNLS